RSGSLAQAARLHTYSVLEQRCPRAAEFCGRGDFGGGPDTPIPTFPRKGGRGREFPSPSTGEGEGGGDPPSQPSPARGEGAENSPPPRRGRVREGVHAPPIPTFPRKGGRRLPNPLPLDGGG